MTVLVVDDDEPTRRMTARMLAADGHSVVQAADGASALELMSDSASDIALVVTDILMPEMPGDELAERIWATADTPVLFMSGAANRTPPGGDDRGLSDFLLKPLDSSSLSRSVRKLLTAASSAPRSQPESAGRRIVRDLRNSIPAGRTLQSSEWLRRHRSAQVILWAHTLLLTVVGLWLYRGDPVHGAAHGLVLLPFAVLAGSRAAGQRPRQIAASLGLLTSSAVIVHLSQGSIEAHFHYFVVVAFLCLYEDWTVFAVAIAYVLFEHATMSMVEPQRVFAHGGNPLMWSTIHAVGILGMGIVNVLAWRFNEDVRQAEARAKRRLAHRAAHDELTGLPNRRFLIEEMERTAAVAGGRSGAAALFVDLDDFKLINDAHGHATGDRLLIDVAERLRRCVRATDLVARSGGDEFVVFARPIETDEQALAAANRILRAFEVPFKIDGVTRTIGASVGVSRFRAEDDWIAEGLSRADAAMYTAKSEGRGRSRLADDGVLLAGQRRRVITEALETCEDADFDVHYQPIVDLRSGEIVALEALLRWEHAELGMVSPADFVPLAERCGRILDLGRWVLERACDDALRHSAQRTTPLRVFVNVSGVQLTRPGFAEMVARTLERTGATGAHIALEMTETAAVEDGVAAAENLAAIRALGVDIVLDDFGVGQSSLAQLASMPVSLIKLDRSFVAGHGDSQRRAMLGAVAGMVRGLHIPSLAEGIETSGQLRLVSLLGFDLAQGYLFARPQPIGHLTEMLRARRPYEALIATAGGGR